MIRKKSCNWSKFKRNGMTLVELLVVVAFISLFAAIVYPNYQAHRLQAHRTTALADMAKIQIELERHYQKGYHAIAESLISAESCTFCDTKPSQFALSISADSDTYTIIATPKGSQLKDHCSGDNYHQLTLNHLGETQPENCW